MPDDHTVYAVPVSATRVTTISFPSPIAEIDGALTLFLIGLLIVLLLVNSRRSSSAAASSSAEKNAPQHGGNSPQLPTTVRRDMVPFNAPDKEPKPPAPPRPTGAKPQPTPPPLPPLSLVAETPAPPAKDAKTFSADFAPFGRLVPCEPVVTVDSSAIQTPIIGLVTEDIFHHGQIIIPAGTEVHGSATVNRARERIASNGRWTLVWQSGEELTVSGLVLNESLDLPGHRAGRLGFRAIEKSPARAAPLPRSRAFRA